MQSNRLCKTGYWAEIEDETVILINKIPNLFLSSETSNEKIVKLTPEHPCNGILYPKSNQIYKIRNNDNDYPAEKINIQKLCNIRTTDKGLNDKPYELYHVFADDYNHINFYFLIKENNIKAYVRFHETQYTQFLQATYCEFPIIIIEAIEAHDRSTRLGSLLMQLVYEYSLNKGFSGKLALYSTNTSGQFFYKMGFTPLEKYIYQQLKEGKNLPGEIMFLTDTAIHAWREKISKNPALFQLKESENQSYSSLIGKNIFKKQTETHSTPNITIPFRKPENK